MGWDGKLVNESYTWVTPIIAEIPELQIFQSTAKAGLLEAGVVPDNGGTFQHLISTKVGGSIFDHTGRRHNAADLLQYSNPDRTTVLLWANTQRVLFDLSNVLSILYGEKPRAVGVVFMDLNGVEHKALLNGETSGGSEVILSAGALGSPQLLLLSGIRLPDQLSAFNIPVVLNQTGVGKNMADNPSNVVWVMTNKPVEFSLIQVVGITDMSTYEVSSGKMQELVLQRIYDAVFSAPADYVRAAAQGGILLQKVQGPYSFGKLR
ncbi:unnamed protein product [Sphagnum jensenii]|uniref:Glucose-methanol-choline oxidoreductase N-terminal domain-containing protein n=1 Tax=Sphagnum jensenii TaxID=128206 RepID=A0ABP1AL66_9BRYO